MSKVADGILKIVLIWAIISATKKSFLVLTGNGWVYVVYLILVLILGFVNIPLYKNKENDQIALNVGGCLLPVCLAIGMAFILGIELGFHNWLMYLSLVVLPAIAVAYVTSSYVEGRGVVSRAIYLPLSVVVLMYLVMTFLGNPGENTTSIKLMLGFMASTIASLVGCDVLRLRDIANDERCGDCLSMGGAGIFDGVFLSGIITMAFVVGYF